jgi:NAD(P)H dehydrogenase (quinone)
MSKKIGIIIGHPDAQSFCHGLAAAYARGAAASGAQVQLLDLSAMEFEPNLRHGYRRRMELEPDLVRAREVMKESDHLVWLYPVWWSTMPAVLKGFLDRTLLPGYAYQFKDGSSRWEKLLNGRTGRMIVTMDSPSWYYRTILRDAGIYAMKKGTLEFCGISPVRTTRLGGMKGSSPNRLASLLNQAEKLGRSLV